jgi:HAMP domain-containing protein
MGLRTKFNLAILAAFILGFCATAVLLNQRFVADAREQVISSAQVMLSEADAVRHYTVTEVEPMLGMERDGKFIAASVPSFAAQSAFRGMRADFPAYAYKEAALNPTNLGDRATDWEADIINAFRQTATRKEIVVERDTPTGVTLSLARPIIIKESACLVCHSTASAAPAAMIASYGSANGFGWKLHEIIGAQIISLPLSVPLQKARQALILFLAMLTGVFLLMLGILNVLLHYLVIRPMTRMSHIATDVSLGNMSADQFKVSGGDEVALLSAAFNRMRQSLETALHMLEERDPAPTP